MKFVEWKVYPKPSSQWIVQASRKDGSDGMQSFPIGFSYSIGLVPFSMQGSHENQVLCAISNWTDQTRRPTPPNRKSILGTLQLNGIVNQTITPAMYFSTLSSYKFVISPEGNGVDTHRT
jgi:hypothetical protein